MRRIINSTYITLDGVIQNPQDWPVSEVQDENSFTIQNDLLQSCDAVLMGRHTYDGFASVWSARSGDPYSDKINSMAKYVASTTLTAPEWNNTTVISDDLVAEIKRLKDEPGGDIVQYGFGEVSYTLLANGLLDELRLWVHPFFVGVAGGADLLFRPSQQARFDLVDTTTLKNGIAILSYQIKQ
ncbi:MAG TPA: dihydrofolate reductase family protein [Pseudonocardiaceae bacterium]|jgi:dihydrofolate reductase|nr:dihydrofolate reductase family protein [Pseudonocardiaceae bacterium]